MTAKELAQKCLDIAQNYKTLYILGCFGAPMNATNKKRYSTNLDYNEAPARAAKINAASADTFGFDCVCLIKGILWGWKGDKTKTYGGASYAVNGVPDMGANQIINLCKNVSTDFSKIEVGEIVWMSGHVGVYVGDGLAVECTPIWKDGVQVTAVLNIGNKSGYNGRKWVKHGKLPYVTYEQVSAPVATPTPAVKMSAVNLPVLKKGAEGDSVKALQVLLKSRGYYLGTYGPNKDGIDGKFGATVEARVREFQKSRGLTQDGIVGPATWAALLGA